MQTRDAMPQPRRTRRKMQGRSDLPEQLHPLPPKSRQRRPVLRQLGLAVTLSLAGLFAASLAIDHCAEDTRFCTLPGQTGPVAHEPGAAPIPAISDAEPEQAAIMPLAPPSRPVLAHAFEPLPLSLDGESTRNFVLPPGRTMLDMATEAGRIDVEDVNLIAVVRQDGVRHALVRLPDGRILRLRQGDALDGGTVAAISEDAIYLIGPDMTPRALVLGG